MNSGLRILHAIHDFVPRHRAGSEIYALELCRSLAARHHVTVLCAEYDPSRRHGHVTWRVHAGLPVIEIVNNWVCNSFADTYRPPLIGDRIGHALNAIQPDIIHVHNLLNLSFDLTRLARERRIPIVATLHDYTLVCPSGGQRIHRAERHVCELIDPGRCARCFRESPFHSQISFGRVAAATGQPALVGRIASAISRRVPLLARRIAQAAPRAISVTPLDIDQRLAAARAVFDDIELFVAPSPSIATQFERLGVQPSKIKVSDYGFAPLRPIRRDRSTGPLRIGFVGTLVWHKGVHVLIDAVRRLPPSAFELKVFGDREVFPDYTADLRAQAAGLPVRFMGAFDRNATADAYAGMDVLVVPSLWLENSPLVIHEAFMAGVPVVGARIGGIADLVDDGRNGLLYEPTSPHALAAALRTLIDRPQRLRDMAGHLPRVKSIADDTREWEAVYSQVLGRRTRQERSA